MTALCAGKAMANGESRLVLWTEARVDGFCEAGVSYRFHGFAGSAGVEYETSPLYGWLAISPPEIRQPE